MVDKIVPTRDLTKDTYCIILAPVNQPFDAHSFKVIVDNKASDLLQLVQLKSDYDPVQKKVHYLYLKPKPETYEWLSVLGAYGLYSDKAIKQESFYAEIPPQWLSVNTREIMHLWDPEPNEPDNNCIPSSMLEKLHKQIRKLRKHRKQLNKCL
ncbi:hypothetical protein CYMTET_4185 [Cymbomonas tetramitiformis]|uniref:Uncharacterized protein n=1 Tax=Cymbomonas tetramitiformis TaxID=36881 RepID=A0AAE0H1L2_9CHLO|nr:hypothetical protein CYMTET_4185 [Cymbomonas tetramitiformis]